MKKKILLLIISVIFSLALVEILIREVIYKKNNYKNVGKRKNYYRSSDGREDGLIFTKHMHLSSFASISRFSIFFLRKIISFDRG